MNLDAFELEHGEALDGGLMYSEISAGLLPTSQVLAAAGLLSPVTPRLGLPLPCCPQRHPTPHVARGRLSGGLRLES